MHIPGKTGALLLATYGLFHGRAKAAMTRFAD